MVDTFPQVFLCILLTSPAFCHFVCFEWGALRKLSENKGRTHDEPGQRNGRPFAELQRALGPDTLPEANFSDLQNEWVEPNAHSNPIKHQHLDSLEAEGLADDQGLLTFIFRGTISGIGSEIPLLLFCPGNWGSELGPVSPPVSTAATFQSMVSWPPSVQNNQKSSVGSRVGKQVSVWLTTASEKQKMAFDR